MLQSLIVAKILAIAHASTWRVSHLRHLRDNFQMLQTEYDVVGLQAGRRKHSPCDLASPHGGAEAMM
jgi:hypothetical protein